jgi:hypothetical protein
MRVIFESKRVPMTFVDPRSKDEHAGDALLRVVLFEPGEESPLIEGTTRPLYSPRLVSDLRAEAGLGKPLVVVPTGQFTKWIEAIVIPDALVRDLPDNARLSYRWRFEPGA